tara:strand:+ start:3797 stop:4435 length:639 start_codon:yes stop_codon:yes gene_type:complete
MLKIVQRNISPIQTIAFALVDYNLEKELFSFFQQKKLDDTSFNKFKNQKRKIEWLSVRYMLNELTPNFQDIEYNKYGKPFLTNLDLHISISHSVNRIACSLNQKHETAVDIQKISPKILRIKDKFLNQHEYELIDQNDITQLTIAWSIKEALFKMYGKDDIFLKPNIEVTSLDFNSMKGAASGRVVANNFDKKFNLNIELIEDYVLAYVVNS